MDTKETNNENIKQDEDLRQEDGQDENRQEDKPTITENQLKDRLARAEKKQEEKYRKEIEDLKEEIKKSKMEEDEAKAYEDELKEKKYQDAINELNYLKMSKVASDKLIEAGLSADNTIIDLLTKDDEESTEEAVNSFSSLVNDLVSKKVKALARDDVPRSSDSFKKPTNDFDIGSYARKNRKIKK